MSMISKKGIYGLSAMYLLAQNSNDIFIQSKEIALKANIPHNYLEQILIILKKHKLVQSIRGNKGGYKISKKPNDITVFEVLNALETCINCIEVPKDNLILENFWNDSQDKMKDIFDISLEDLVKQNKQNIIFSI